jgi:hypothetical protein
MLRVRAEAEARNFPSARYCDTTPKMAKQTTLISKKRKGPAPTGKGTPVMVRLQPSLLASLDKFISAESGHLTRPEAIRKLLDDALDQHGFTSGR